MSATTMSLSRADCERVLAKHPDALPVVLRGAEKSSLVVLPATATVADIERAVREVGGFRPRRAVALTVAGCVPAATTAVADLLAACKSEEDGFLHVHYSGERVMGMAAAGPCFAGSMGGGGGGGGAPDPSALGGLGGGAMPSM